MEYGRYIILQYHMDFSIKICQYDQVMLLSKTSSHVCSIVCSLFFLEKNKYSIINIFHNILNIHAQKVFTHPMKNI